MDLYRAVRKRSMVSVRGNYGEGVCLIIVVASWSCIAIAEVYLGYVCARVTRELMGFPRERYTVLARDSRGLVEEDRTDLWKPRVGDEDWRVGAQ